MLESIKELLHHHHEPPPEPEPEPEPEPQPEWNTYCGLFHGVPTALKLAGNARELYGEDHPVHVEISIGYAKFGYGDFPPQGVCENLDALEKTMVDYFEEHECGVPVARTIDRGRRTLHFYCTDAETFAVDCENDTFIPPQEFDIDATIDDDPEWSVFEELSAGTETMGSHF